MMNRHSFRGNRAAALLIPALALAWMLVGALPRAQAADITVNADCPLDAAITSANSDSNSHDTDCVAGSGTDTITLTANVTLNAALSTINTTIIIDGAGKTISRGTGNFRPFEVDNTPGDLTLRNVTVSGFNEPSGKGGAILSEGRLRLENCVFKDNSAADNGGAIHVGIGELVTIHGCAFIGNDSVGGSGALMFDSGDFTMSNSTFVGNTCSGSGCALFLANGGNIVDVWHSTFWDNTSDTAGNYDGIYSTSTTDLRLFNSIIGNSAAKTNKLCGGRFVDSNTERGILTWNGPAIDECGTRTVANPQLGGQTGFPPHLPLGAGSAAIGAGLDAQCDNYPTDQRGVARPAANCDIGAVQYYALPDEGGGEDLGPPKTGGVWVRSADGSWRYERPGEEQDRERRIVCTGEALNESSAFKVSTTYGLCNGVQFNQLELSAIGIGYIVEAGPTAAVDVWGWVTAYVEVCWRGQASALFLDAATSPRTVSQLATAWDGEFTCAQISSAGTVVFMPAQSYLTTPPADAASPGAPSGAAPFGSCMVQLNAILNLRATPGGDVRMILPYGVKLTAFQRSGDWVEVDYHGLRGWVSASHVTFEGDC